MGRSCIHEGETQKERDAARMRAHRAEHPGLDKRIDMRHRGDNQPFIAIDGEALGESGYHLLAASTGDQVEDRSTKGLSSFDCLRFLLRLREEHPGCLFIGFALGYDCEHWIRDLGANTWIALRDDGKAYIQIDGQTFSLEYLPKKWFKLKLMGPSKDKGPWKQGVQIFDVFSFYQTGFVSAVQEWGGASPEEMEVLVEWKGKRGDFKAEDWDAIVRYNQIECAVLVRLAGKLRAALLEIDVRLTSWHGPGAVANNLLTRYNMKEHIAQPPRPVDDAIAHAYFGGRFQVFKFGHIEGVYDYDISSAYPHATTLLPSTQGRWERVDAYQGDDAPWTLYLVSWKIDAGFGELTPFPWRSKEGIIHYPSYGRGWYWGWEVAAARRGWGDAIRVEDGWRLYPESEGVFGWMKELAAKRVEAKQNAKQTCGAEQERWQGIARAYKLALNSVYGKTIQTVGKYKPFLCPMWAGLITAFTRSRLMDAAIASVGSLVCFATDGLFSSAPLTDVQVGNSLGDWELAAEGIRLELYQSGCYAIFKDGEMVDSRFRGVSRGDVPWGEMRAAWKKDQFGGSVKVSSKRFTGHRTALQHNKPEQQSKWIALEKDVQLMPGTGLPQSYDKNTSLWWSMLANTDYNEVSARYRKLPPGETDWEREEEEVQP